MKKHPALGLKKGPDDGRICRPLFGRNMGDVSQRGIIVRQGLARFHVFVDEEAIDAMLESRQVTSRLAIFLNLPAIKFHV